MFFGRENYLDPEQPRPYILHFKPRLKCCLPAGEKKGVFLFTFFTKKVSVFRSISKFVHYATLRYTTLQYPTIQYI